MQVQAYIGPGPKVTFGFIGAKQKRMDKFFRKLNKELAGVGEFHDKDIDGSRVLLLGQNTSTTIDQVTSIARQIASTRKWSFRLFDESRFSGEST